ncbi:DUF4920 domain-containing protein [Dyadobacter tibetensis]|uniref:DUF4920 domain-containing protein n=1 Tax=Dyadobacter tibetensis TaxID=1211851 RepID=UPI00046F49E8|nr:DUF4920 domain-containing protein [Dyadobacter tibetensis]
MKAILIMLVALSTWGQAAWAQNREYFGKKINENRAMAATDLPSKMGDKPALKAKVTGTVESVCQMKGCWMKVNLNDGHTMRVMFKEYAFFVPKDIAGKTVVMEGEALKKIVSVDHLQHYAKDAGKSQAEIDAITEPSEELTFVANGLIVK